MPQRRSSRGLIRAASFVLAVALLAGCSGSGDHEPSGEPSFYRDLAKPGAELDAAAAQSMISGYRQNNGLAAVTLDPQLMTLADQQAHAMAARDKLDHNVGRPFVDRIKSSGFDAKVAAENVSAGYHTVAEAFSGWRDSPPHRANMLLKGATQMGIAAVYAPGSKYKVFWSLILAAPDDRPGGSGTLTTGTPDGRPKPH
ncbi:MAG: CAP domain-containing protein [Xanthobacteraceae bacterium]|jgi:uncharacterized protein YkwD